MTEAPLAASVVICTYNRLELLKAAVASCLRDASPRGARFEIVVSDNSPDGHARRHVEALAAGGHPVRWVAVSPPNISLARNAGLAAARAERVAFLDDDLVVEIGWLDHLIETLEQTRADVVIGPVRPVFAEGSPPLWDPEGGAFTRVLDRPTGSVIVLRGRARPRGFVVSTASSIWRRGTCFTDAEPFDPAYGASGGEDLDLFLRLDRRGRRVVWCAEAGVWETIPASRTDLAYQAARAYSGGQVYAALAARHSALPAVSAALNMTAGAVQLAQAGASLAVATLLRGDPAQTAARHRLRAAAAAGKLSWWRRMPLYQLENAKHVRAS